MVVSYLNTWFNSLAMAVAILPDKPRRMNVMGTTGSRVSNTSDPCASKEARTLVDRPSPSRLNGIRNSLGSGALFFFGNLGSSTRKTTVFPSRSGSSSETPSWGCCDGLGPPARSTVTDRWSGVKESLRPSPPLRFPRRLARLGPLAAPPGGARFCFSIPDTPHT